METEAHRGKSYAESQLWRCDRSVLLPQHEHRPMTTAATRWTRWQTIVEVPFQRHVTQRRRLHANNKHTHPHTCAHTNAYTHTGE